MVFGVFKGTSKLTTEVEFRQFGRPVPDSGIGMRTDAYLGEFYRFRSRSEWQKRLRLGQVTVSGATVDPSRRLKGGESFAMIHSTYFDPPVNENIRRVWQKGAVMVVEKPAHLPMHETGRYRKTTFASLLVDHFGKEWAAVHRLDKETSGLVLCGATHSVRLQLAQGLEGRRIGKQYLAIAAGVAEESVFRVDAPVGDCEDSLIRIKKWVVPGGLDAITDFCVEGTRFGWSLLRCHPKTGRTNQIRIHAAYSGMPLVGDKMYHPDEQVFLDYFIEGNSAAVIERAGFHRQALHACYLRFEHPELRETCEVEIGMSDELQALWDGQISLVPRQD